MQFFSPEAFLFLWTVPAVGGLFWLSHKLRERRLSQIGNVTTLEGKLMPAYDKAERPFRALLWALVFIFATLALARPQWGEEKKKIERKGVDVIFLLDTSLSMLAEDVKPNRFEKAKLEIRSMVRNLKGDRVGMVAFAGSGFLQTPLTLDYSAFFLFLDAIKVGYIPDPGTSLNQALRLALKSFPEKNLKYKAIVLLTDGEDHEGSLETALAEAKKAELRIYCVGVGTPEGDPIPLKDEEGHQTGFKKDRSGQVVVTKLNAPLLEKIASETGAIYLPSTPGEQELEVILKHMESLGKRQFKEKLVSEKEDHYQIFLVLAFLFLAGEMLTKRTRLAKMKPLALIFLFFLTTGFFESPKGLTDSGNKLYQEKKYLSARDYYQKAKVKDPDDPAIRYNLGTTLYQTQQYQEAAKELEKSIALAKDPGLKAKALYNCGNAQYRLGEFEKAIDSYKKALELNPNDVDSKYNLEFLQKQKSMFDKKDQDRKKEQNKQQQNQQKNQQQQNQGGQGQQNQQQNQQQQNQQQNQQNNPQNQNQQQDQQQQQPQDQQQNQNPDQDQKDPQNPQKNEQQNPQDKGEDFEGQDTKPNDQGQEKDEKPKEKEGENQEEQNPQEQNEQAEPQKKDVGGEHEQKASQQPLQGQMTLQNALQILDALKDGEKELQDLRRPRPPQNPPQVEKDW